MKVLFVQTRWQVKCVCENPSRVRPNVLVASCGNKRGGTNKLKMIVVCIYMHRFEPFQLKKMVNMMFSRKRQEIQLCNATLATCGYCPGKNIIPLNLISMKVKENFQSTVFLVAQNVL